MSDLLVPAPSIPSVRLKTLLPPNRHDAKTASLRSSKSTPHLRSTNNGGALSRTVKGVNDYWLSWRDGLSSKQRDERRLREEQRQILSLRMRNADTLAQWEAAAKDLDHLEGNDEWKEDDTTPNDLYNPGLIAERLQGLNAARESCDIHQMMHLVRTALSRDLGGMDSVDLYRHSYIGTKGLIERYVDSTLATIDTIISQSTFDTSVEHRDLLDGMLYARQSFGRSALLLSGGGTFGMAHVGVLKSLFESKLLPRIISGASAGSIVSAVMCTQTDEEIPGILQAFPYGNLAVFEEEENRDGVLGHLRRLLTEGSWSDIKHLTSVMREITGDLTFQEAYNRTRRILNICVSTASIYELPRLLNYVTAPNVMIWSAVAASCSVPLVFNASPLLVKDPVTGEHSPWNPTPQHWIDGSVDNDLPMTRLAEMFNVNHFIVSQVNPHVVPFLSKDDHLSPDASERPKASSHPDEMDWVYTLTTLAKEEAMHRLQFLAEMGIFPNLATKFRSILSQRYSGDITILPEMALHDLPRLLANPTSDFMLRSCLAGERATWPKLSRVRDRCAIELALDRAVHRLRARVVFSESHQDLQKHHYSIGNLKIHGQKAVSTPTAKSQPRQRRQSGGGLLSTANRRALLDLDQTKNPHARTSSQATYPPALKRASKSHIQVTQHGRDLSIHPDTSVEVYPCPSPNTVRKNWLDPWPTSKPASGVLVTATHDEADTSELGPSDEPKTDGSETEWDNHSSTSTDTDVLKKGLGDTLRPADIDVSEDVSA